MSEPEIPDDPTLVELREQTKWLRFLALRELLEVLKAQLKDDTQRRAFELSDGTRSTRAVGGIVGVSNKTIAIWWQRWTSAGIANADKTGRVTRLTSLKSVGLDVPVGATSRSPEEVADE